MTNLFDTYAQFFETAFRKGKPFDYQTRLATMDLLPDLVNVPTGARKTAAVLGAWMWRRLHYPQSVGRRLIFCLPMRTLVEQTAGVAQSALENLGLTDRVSIHILMGGSMSEDWEHFPDRECILIGTQDMLISRALNRGYAMSRFRWPIHFSLLNNDCLWVLDEIQLMGDGLASTTQLEAFRRQFGTFGSCRSIWMSATLDCQWLGTIDFRSFVPKLNQLELSDADRADKTLDQRLNAVKRVGPAPVECRTPTGLARFVAECHQPGTQTLVVVNRVVRARETYDELEKLLHPVNCKSQSQIANRKWYRLARRGAFTTDGHDVLLKIRRIKQPEHPGSLMFVKLIFPTGYHNHGHTVSNQVGDGPYFRHKPVHS